VNSQPFAMNLIYWRFDAYVQGGPKIGTLFVRVKLHTP